MEDSVQIIARSGDFDNTPCQHCNLSKMEYVKVQINGTVDYKLQCINPTCKSFLGFGPNLKKVVTGYTYYKTLEPDPTFNQEIKMYLADENGTLFDASFKGSLTTIFGIPAGYLFFGLLAGLFGKYIFLFVYWVLPIFYIYLFRAIPGDFENRMKRLLIALILTILVLSIVTSINDEYFGNRTLAIFLSGLILLIGGTIISYKTEPVGDLMLLYNEDQLKYYLATINKEGQNSLQEERVVSAPSTLVSASANPEPSSGNVSKPGKYCTGCGAVITSKFCTSCGKQ